MYFLMMRSVFQIFVNDRATTSIEYPLHLLI
jgi:hypothetical protein